jgi:hypothetical protein
MAIESGSSIFSQFPSKNVTSSGNGGSPGGNSGAVISPTPKLGWSAYQSSTIPVAKTPKIEGES